MTRHTMILSLIAMFVMVLAMGGELMTSCSAEPQGNPPFHVVFLQHAGEVNGKAFGDIIAEAARVARLEGERLVFVMEWAGAHSHFSAWRSFEPALASVDFESFLSMDAAPSGHPEVEAKRLALLKGYVTARNRNLLGTRIGKVIGHNSNPFAREVNRALEQATDVIDHWFIEGSYPDEGKSAEECARIDQKMFQSWLPSSQAMQRMRIPEYIKMLQLIQAGDATGFSVASREAVSLQVRAARERNHVMTETLLALRDWRRTRPKVKVILFYGLAHRAHFPAREVLGSELKETTIDPICGKYDRLDLFAEDLEATIALEDGTSAERYTLAQMIAPPGLETESDYFIDRDAVFGAMNRAQIFDFIRSLRSESAVPMPQFVGHMQSALCSFVEEQHPERDARRAARHLLVRWFGKMPRPALALGRDTLIRHRHHAIADGDAGPPRDVALHGTLQRPHGAMSYRAFIRQEPFALREEFAVEGQPTLSYVTDGSLAWRLLPDGRAEPATDFAAISLSEQAFVMSFAYLDPQYSQLDATVTGTFPPSQPPFSHLPGEFPFVGVMMRAPSGTVWRFDFDASDGRLHGRYEQSVAYPRFYRYSEWRQVGSYTLPSRITYGQVGTADHHSIILDRLEGNLRHPDDLFGGIPSAEDRRAIVVPMQVEGQDMPGSALLMITAGSVNNRQGCRGIIDLGSVWAQIDPMFALSLGIANYSPPQNSENSLTALPGRVWLNEIVLGNGSLLQTMAWVHRSGNFHRFLPEEAPGIGLAGRRVRGSPLTLLPSEGRLILGHMESRPVRKGVDPPRSAALLPITVPLNLRRDLENLFLVALQIENRAAAVDAVVDTALPEFLRLERSGLIKLGFPVDPDYWKSRGAYEVPGAPGQTSSGVFHLQLSSVRIGGILYERPWCTIALGPGSDSFEARMGTAALLPFVEACFDGDRKQLILVPGPELVPVKDGQLKVGAPAGWTGIELGPSPLPARALVLRVAMDSPAAAAGVVSGDEILSVDGGPNVVTLPGFRRAMWIKSGQPLQLRISRGTEVRDILIR